MPDGGGRGLQNAAWLEAPAASTANWHAAAGSDRVAAINHFASWLRSWTTR